jgi:hypothetical protein
MGRLGQRCKATNQAKSKRKFERACSWGVFLLGHQASQDGTNNAKVRGHLFLADKAFERDSAKHGGGKRQ